jgi:energy-coupling factor transport system permease protein
MSDFDVMRFLAIGQCVPTGSILHRLDPRVKLLALVMAITALMAQQRLGLLGLGLFIMLVLYIIAMVDLRYALRGLVPLLPLFGFVLVLQLLFYPHRQVIEAGGILIWRWKSIWISWASIVSIAAMAVRMVAIVLLLTLYTSIADISDLTHGVDGLLQPFQRFGFPSHELALMVVISFRFVPLLGQELERLMKAQAARGGEFGRGWGLQRIRRLFPLFVPLFIAALRRSEELAIAMEARGYTGGRGRTRLVSLHMRSTDWLALFIVIAFCAIMVILSF